MTTLTLYTTASNQDGFGVGEDSSGTFDNSSAFIEVGFDDTSMEKNTAFLWFDNVTVDPSATLNSATLYLYGDEDSSTSFDTRIYGFRQEGEGYGWTNNPPADEDALLPNGGQLDGLPGYEVTVAYRPGSGFHTGEAGVEDGEQGDVAVTTVVQEIFDAETFESGDPLLFQILYYGDESETERYRWRSYDYSGSTYTPKLVIDYTAGGADAVPMALNTYQQMRNK